MIRRKLTTLGTLLFSGVLLGLSYPTMLGFWSLIFVALTPLLYVVLTRNQTGRELFLSGFVYGLGYFALVVSWYFAIYPLDWLGISSKFTSLILISLTFVLILCVCSLFFGLFALILGKTKNFLSQTKHQTINFILFISSLWVVLEYLRAWMFSIFWFGPGALLGPHWTMGDLGYALHAVAPLRMLASLGGVYLLSFLIVSVNVGLLFLIKHKDFAFVKPKSVALTLMAVIVLWLASGTYIYMYASSGKVTNETSVKVVLVTTDFSRDYSSNIRDLLVKPSAVLTKFGQALKLRPDVIVLPEGSELTTALADYYGSLSKAQSALATVPNAKPFIILDHITVTEPTDTHPHSRLLFFDTVSGTLGHYDKRLLFPNSEYIPDIMDLLMRLAGQSRLLNTFEYLRVLDPGKFKDVVVETRYGKIGGLICGDILSPELSRGLARNGAEIIMVSTSDATYNGAQSLVRENEAMAQIRAVETGRAFIQATNRGESYAMNSRGDVLASYVASSSLEVLNLKLENKQTIYARFGNWILILSALILFVSFVKLKPIIER